MPAAKNCKFHGFYHFANQKRSTFSEKITLPAQFLLQIFPFSLTINTPALYAKLEKGEIEAHHVTIYVEAGAHPHVLSLPQLYWNASYQEMHFTDAKGNEIVISPGSRSTQAYFIAGEGLTLGIPQNYEQYFVFFDNDAIATADDIYRIVRWRAATRVTISDRADMAYSLSKQMNEMRKMKRLRSLSLDVQRRTYKRLSLKQFLRKLPRLQTANFLAPSLSEQEFKEFVALQEPEKGWHLEAKFKLITYQRCNTRH